MIQLSDLMNGYVEPLNLLRELRELKPTLVYFSGHRVRTAGPADRAWSPRAGTTPPGVGTRPPCGARRSAPTAGKPVTSPLAHQDCVCGTRPPASPLPANRQFSAYLNAHRREQWLTAAAVTVGPQRYASQPPGSIRTSSSLHSRARPCAIATWQPRSASRISAAST